MTIIFVKPCKKEILSLPLEVRQDLADALARLEEGQQLIFPLCRMLHGLSHKTVELRLWHKSGTFRVFVSLRGIGRVVVLHAFKKKSQKTPRRVIELVKRRLQEI